MIIATAQRVRSDCLELAGRDWHALGRPDHVVVTAPGLLRRTRVVDVALDHENNSVTVVLLDGIPEYPRTVHLRNDD